MAVLVVCPVPIVCGVKIFAVAAHAFGCFAAADFPDFSLQLSIFSKGKLLFYHLLDFKQQLFIKKFPHIFTGLAGVAQE